MEKKDISLISFSRTGGRLSAKIRDELNQCGFRAEAYVLSRYAAELGLPAALPDRMVWCREHWETDRLIVFVGASGIAVRTIAPFVRSKVTDPAVLVIDETGHFVISLLSGHLGGANMWAALIAEKIGAQPVITTATDSHGLFAVDVWAKKNGLVIDSMKQAKEVSAALLREETVYLCCPEGAVDGTVPKELTFVRECPKVPEKEDEIPMLILVDYRRASAGIATGVSEESDSCSPDPCAGDPQRIEREVWPESRLLRLIPPCITIGVGCRRDQDPEIVRQMTEKAAAMAEIDLRSVEKITSIDLKKNETGIRRLAEKLGVPFVTYSTEKLKAVEGCFTASSFVAGVTGVDNVCERAAVLGSDCGKMILRKQAGSGVTDAAAMRTWRIEF